MLLKCLDFWSLMVQNIDLRLILTLVKKYCFILFSFIIVEIFIPYFKRFWRRRWSNFMIRKDSQIDGFIFQINLCKMIIYLFDRNVVQKQIGNTTMLKNRDICKLGVSWAWLGQTQYLINVWIGYCIVHYTWILYILDA